MDSWSPGNLDEKERNFSKLTFALSEISEQKQVEESRVRKSLGRSRKEGD